MVVRATVRSPLCYLWKAEASITNVLNGCGEKKVFSFRSVTRNGRRLYHRDSSVIRLWPLYRHHIWSVDFGHDKLSSGRFYKMLTVLDEYICQALCVEVKPRMGSADVLEALYPLLLEHGKPDYIRSDNGSEFIATALQLWLRKVGIKPIQIYPGSPWENRYNERFNGTLRNEILNAEWFTSIAQVQTVINM